MTSFFLKHPLNSFKCFSSGSSLSGRRAIHCTSVVHRQKSIFDIEDLFRDDIAPEPDLFAEPEKTKTQNDATIESKGDPIKSKGGPIEKGSRTPKPHLSERSVAFKRHALFNKNIHFLEPLLGSLPPKISTIRSRTWVTMMQLARNGEDMTKVLHLIHKFHESGGALPSLFAEEFVRRCEQLGCQPLALEVFGDYIKYKIILTPEAGRWLIHSLHVLHPFEDLLIAASLFSTYNISLDEDLVSASMFTAACFKHDTPQSRTIANSLLPKIKTMVEEKKYTTPVSDVEMKRQRVWVDWSLKKINKFVKKSSGQPFVPLPAVQVQVSVIQP